jgi:hypothetical protein
MTPEAIASPLDTISIPNLHDAGVLLYQNEYRSLLPSPVRCRQKKHLRQCDSSNSSDTRFMVVGLYSPHYLSMRLPYMGQLGLHWRPVGTVLCGIY